MRCALTLGLALLALTGCAANVINDPIAEVQRRAYADGGTASLTLYTVLSNETDRGAHTALLIDGAQRVLWDPAGSFRHPFVPERADLLYGITPNIERAYVDYHARITYRVVEQRIEVPQAVADQAMALAAGSGAAGNATCARTTSRILRQLPGLSDIGQTWYPLQLMDDFGRLPGATQRVITDDDADKNHNVVFVDVEQPLRE